LLLDGSAFAEVDKPTPTFPSWLSDIWKQLSRSSLPRDLAEAFDVLADFDQGSSAVWMCFTGHFVRMQRYSCA